MMSQHPPQWSDEELERALRALGPAVDLPPTPSLAPTVARRITEGRRPRWPWWQRWPGRLAVAATLALIVVGLVTIAWPSGPAALADRLGLGGIILFYRTGSPTATLTPSATLAPPPAASPPAAGSAPPPSMAPGGTPGARDSRLRPGRLVSLAEARTRLPWPVRVPTAAGLGEPDEIYLDEGSPPSLTYIYLARADRPPARETGVAYLLTQLRGTVDEPLFAKGLGPETRLTRVMVGASPGYWIEGQPHAIFYFGENGRVLQEEVRLAGNVLLWQHGDVLLRLEGATSREVALDLAAEVR